MEWYGKINSFGRDEDIWYVVPVDSTVFLIAVREIIEWQRGQLNYNFLFWRKSV